MIPTQLADRVDIIRDFNRFFTRQIGVLRDGLLHTPYSLTEARLLFEMGSRQQVTATELRRALGLDAGYMSRLLSRLEEQGLLEGQPDDADGRQRQLRLTPHGRQTFELLNTRSQEEIAESLASLNEDAQVRLLQAMLTIRSTLDSSFKFSEPFVLRPHEPGDMGWVVQQHGALYAHEYGWTTEFEALVASIVSDFLRDYNPSRERCWIAEMGGERVGSVFLVEHDATTAKLRLLLVDPKARGTGLGSRLVAECIRFAKRAGYQMMILWTNNVLVEARHIYQKTGFQLVAEEPHHSFGHDLVGETWELTL